MTAHRRRGGSTPTEISILMAVGICMYDCLRDKAIQAIHYCGKSEKRRNIYTFTSAKHSNHKCNSRARQPVMLATLPVYTILPSVEFCIY